MINLPALDDLDVTATNVRSSCCTSKAWDVDVTLSTAEGVDVAAGEVTLVVGCYRGVPSVWGGLDNWVGDGPLLDALRDHRHLAVRVAAAVRGAIEASDVRPSPPYEERLDRSR